MFTFLTKEKEEIEVVSCNDCNVLIEKKYACKVVLEYSTLSRIEHHFYCQAHIKPYDKKVVQFYRSDIYFKTLEVDRDGVPVGYHKDVE